MRPSPPSSWIRAKHKGQLDKSRWAHPEVSKSTHDESSEEVQVGCGRINSGGFLAFMLVR